MPESWIFFDVGGVLTDESKYTEWRIDNDLAIIRRWIPGVSREELVGIWGMASSLHTGLDEAILAQFLAGADLAEGLKALKKTKDEAPSYIDQQVVRPEARETLRALSGSHSLGLIANQPGAIREKLGAAGLLECLSYDRVSEDVGLSKPDSAYFRKVFEQTGADPRTSWMVDDNVERGLLPAKALGMTTVWYPSAPQPAPEGVNYVIASLNEVAGLV
ncbi:MAG: HAD family hydrolase [bacterium]